MSLPAFFDEVPQIVLRDPLAAFLGASDDGLLRYGYADAVRLAGHSCPTVASAYAATRLALKALYGDDLPERGGIRVEFRQAREAGATGVIANVVSLLTGAMADDGFKGLAGRYARRQLLSFGEAIEDEIRFTRIDTDQSVGVSVDLGDIPAAAELPELMSRSLDGSATDDEAAQFRRLWQDRVRRILLEHGDDPTVFGIRPL